MLAVAQGTLLDTYFSKFFFTIILTTRVLKELNLIVILNYSEFGVHTHESQLKLEISLVI